MKKKRNVKKTKNTKKPAKAKVRKISKAKVREINAYKPSDTKPQKPGKKAPEEIMDRNSLKVIVSQLKEMGSDIKVFKSDTDEGLQKKVNEAIQKLPPPDMLKKLETVQPDALVSVLKKDCLGIFIDLSDVSCVRCIDSGTCAREFIKNLKGGFKVLDAALVPVDEPKKAKSSKAEKIVLLIAGRTLFCSPVKKYVPVASLLCCGK